MLGSYLSLVIKAKYVQVFTKDYGLFTSWVLICIFAWRSLSRCQIAVNQLAAISGSDFPATAFLNEKLLFHNSEMAEFMKLVAKNSSGMEMTVEERNLLSVAYKNVIGARRAAWRIISSLEQKGKDSGKESGKDHGKVETLKKYKETVEGELQSICDEILSLLEKDLIPNSQDNEARVFFHKMWVTC